ncbi:MAG: hypothetical protein R3C10_04030 [Pirellulales bacterium]
MIDVWRPRCANCGGITESDGQDCLACQREPPERHFIDPSPEEIERLKAEIRTEWAQPGHVGVHAGGGNRPYVPRVVRLDAEARRVLGVG